VLAYVIIGKIYVLYNIQRFRCERPHTMFDSMAMQPRAALSLVEIFFTWWLNRSFLSKWIPSQHIEGVTKIFDIDLSHSISSIWVAGSSHFLYWV